MRLALAVGCVLAVVGSLGFGSAAELTDEARQQADFVLAGMKDARDRLQSGTFRARGRWGFEKLTESGVHEVDVAVFCAFDFPTNKFRFDRREKPSTVSPGVSKSGFALRYVRKPGASFCWNEDSHSVVIRPQENEILGRLSPFDVRIVGLANWAAFRQGFQHGFSYSELIEYVTKQTEQALSEVVSETETLHRLSWTPQPSLKNTIWFDEEQGFSPVRYEQRIRYSHHGDAEVSGLDPTCIVDATWQEIAGVWVPKTLVMQLNKRTIT